MRVFISYRRAESAAFVGVLYDHLAAAFGAENVFLDTKSLPLGVDYRSVLNREIGAADAVLVIIGANWARLTDEQGVRRLDDPADLVRFEIELALRRRALLIIPILTQGAAMPTAADLPPSLRSLSFRQAISLRDDIPLAELEQLVAALRRHERANVPTTRIDPARIELPPAPDTGTIHIQRAPPPTPAPPEPMTAMPISASVSPPQARRWRLIGVVLLGILALAAVIWLASGGGIGSAAP